MSHAERPDYKTRLVYNQIGIALANKEADHLELVKPPDEFPWYIVNLCLASALVCTIAIGYMCYKR